MAVGAVRVSVRHLVLGRGANAELAPEHGVACTHGDMIPEALDALARVDGLALGPHYPFAKGSIWVLDGDARPLVRATYVDPRRG